MTTSATVDPSPQPSVTIPEHSDAVAIRKTPPRQQSAGWRRPPTRAAKRARDTTAETRPHPRGGPLARGRRLAVGRCRRAGDRRRLPADAVERLRRFRRSNESAREPLLPSARSCRFALDVHESRRPLSAAHVALVRPRLPALGHEPAGLSPDERAAPRRERRRVLRAERAPPPARVRPRARRRSAGARDRRRDQRRVLRAASAARRVGGVGDRAPRRAVGALRAACPRCLRPRARGSPRRFRMVGALLVRGVAAREAGRHELADRPRRPRRVPAATTAGARRRVVATRRAGGLDREDPLRRAGRAHGGRRRHRRARGRYLLLARAVRDPGAHRAGVLRARLLPGEDGGAGRAVAALPAAGGLAVRAPRRPARDGVRRRGDGAPRRRPSPLAVGARGLGRVRGAARARLGNRAGGPAHRRRPLYLSRDARLGGRGRRRRVRAR